MASMAGDRKLPAPEYGPDTKPFWDAAREGKLMLKRGKCGKPHWYPRAICPFDFTDTEWFEASGKGKIYSYSVMRRAPVPYAIGYVTLEEGVSMMTNFVDCDMDALKIGMDVKVVFKPTEGDGPPLPCFAPA